MRWCLWLPLLLACEVDAMDGQFLCPDGECPPGQTCNAAGVCVDNADMDAGLDAMMDVGVDATDAAVDSPIDVFDAGTDTGTLESCDESDNGFGVDEDGDGSIDEGCTFTFGVPHPITSAHVSSIGFHFSPELSDDGRTLYFAQGRVYRANRESLTEPFGLAEIMLDEAADSVTVFTENEYYIQRGGEILPVVDGTVGAAISITLDERPVDGAFHPSVSQDGFDLIVAADVDGERDILLSRRGNLADGFMTWTRLFGSDSDSDRDEFPRISADRLTLWFLRNEELFVSRRATPTTTDFSAPERFTGLPSDARQPFYRPESREIVFVRAGSPPWAPAGISMWRVQVCRDGFACEDEMPECPSGITSADGFHCYARNGALTAYADITCPTGFPVTIHSANELGVLARLGSMLPLWLGGQRVAGGVDMWDGAVEPFLYTELDASAPIGCYITDVGGARWATTQCTNFHEAACETQMWPTWLAP